MSDINNALPKQEISSLVQNFLFNDQVFLKDLCRHLDMPFERIADEKERKEFFDGDCTHNGARSYIFQMLVFKHMFRLCKIGCKDFLDPYWQSKVEQAVVPPQTELTEEETAALVAFAKNCKNLSIVQLQKHFCWGFHKSALAYEWYQAQAENR